MCSGTLTAGKIDHVQHCIVDCFLRFQLGLDDDSENTVGSRTSLIKVGAGHLFIVGSQVEERTYLLQRTADLLCKVHHTDAGFLVFLKLEILVIGVKQIVHTLIVELYVGTAQHILALRCPGYTCEDCVDGQVYQPRNFFSPPVHGVGFSRASLPVAEDAAVVAFHAVPHDLLGHLLEDF